MGLRGGAQKRLVQRLLIQVEAFVNTKQLKRIICRLGHWPIVAVRPAG
jgi:hypothetical protein